MTPVFEIGTKVRFNDDIIAAAPAYTGVVYTILAATASWEIGTRNEWYGDYLIESANGEKSVTRESCLVAAA